MIKPENLKVVAGLSVVRNSVGENSYVADEIITSRAGKRIRVVNNDAEGRLAMAEVLCYMSSSKLYSNLISLNIKLFYLFFSKSFLDEGKSQELCQSTLIYYCHSHGTCF